MRMQRESKTFGSSSYFAEFIDQTTMTSFLLSGMGTTRRRLRLAMCSGVNDPRLTSRSEGRTYVWDIDYHSLKLGVQDRVEPLLFPISPDSPGLTKMQQ